MFPLLHLWGRRCRPLSVPCIRPVVYVAVWSCFVFTGLADAHCTGGLLCESPASYSYRARHDGRPGDCYDNTTVLTYTCTRGFQQNGASFLSSCNGTSGEWSNNGSCDIDLLSIVVAVSLSLVVLLITGSTMYLIRRNRRTRQYDTNDDVPAQAQTTPVTLVNAAFTYDQPDTPEPIYENHIWFEQEDRPSTDNRDTFKKPVRAIKNNPKTKQAPRPPVHKVRPTIEHGFVHGKEFANGHTNDYELDENFVDEDDFTDEDEEYAIPNPSPIANSDYPDEQIYMNQSHFTQ